MRTTKTWSLASLIIGILGVVSAHAQQTFSLAWNANPEPDIVSYRVHVGTSTRQYTQSFATTAPSIDISTLPAGPTYFFAVTAVNSAGLESDFSSEISSAGAPSGPLVNSSLSATAIRMTVQTSPSTVVAFDSSTNLVDWQFFANRTANASGVATLNQTRSTSGPRRFYRVRLP
ncbi:MAG TPA: fibronectin type III domain-containing protein [Verrucomicrobiae bacterium]